MDVPQVRPEPQLQQPADVDRQDEEADERHGDRRTQRDPEDAVPPHQRDAEREVRQSLQEEHARQDRMARHPVQELRRARLRQVEGRRQEQREEDGIAGHVACTHPHRDERLAGDDDEGRQRERDEAGVAVRLDQRVPELSQVALGIEVAEDGREHPGHRLHDIGHVKNQLRRDGEMGDRLHRQEGADHERVRLESQQRRDADAERHQPVAGELAEHRVIHRRPTDAQSRIDPMHRRPIDQRAGHRRGDRDHSHRHHAVAPAQHPHRQPGAHERHRRLHATDPGESLEPFEHVPEQVEGEAERRSQPEDQHEPARRLRPVPRHREDAIQVPRHHPGHGQHEHAEREVRDHRRADDAPEVRRFVIRRVVRHEPADRVAEAEVEQAVVAGQRRHQHPQTEAGIPQMLEHVGGENEPDDGGGAEGQPVRQDVAHEAGRQRRSESIHDSSRSCCSR